MKNGSPTIGNILLAAVNLLIMAYWNHFAEDTRTKIMFKDLAIKDKFRVVKWRGKRRSVVIAIKTGEKTYIEERSKKETSLFSVDNYEVYAF